MLNSIQHLVERIQKIFNKVFQKSTLEEREYSATDKGAVVFKSIKTVNKTPLNSEIQLGEFIEVVYQNKPIWALFQCPCGCRTIISLPLQKTHDPFWTLQRSKQNRATLYPSVWQKNGCKSHFWIRDGAVVWATFENLGANPFPW